MRFRVYVYWMDEPDGKVWQIDRGNQGPNGELAEIYREVILEGVDAKTVVAPGAHADSLAKREPKCWLEVHGELIKGGDGVAVITGSSMDP